MKLNPYIGRDGDAREMLEYYHGLLGGKIDLQTYGQSPMPAPESHKNRILHGRVDVGDVTIMASDAPPNMPLSSTHANISLSLGGPEEDKLKQVFTGLSEGGKVTMSLEKQFWGDTFGMVQDKFGTAWMINIEAPDSKPKAG